MERNQGFLTVMTISFLENLTHQKGYETVSVLGVQSCKVKYNELHILGLRDQN